MTKKIQTYRISLKEMELLAEYAEQGIVGIYAPSAVPKEYIQYRNKFLYTQDPTKIFSYFGNIQSSNPGLFQTGTEELHEKIAETISKNTGFDKQKIISYINTFIETYAAEPYTYIKNLDPVLAKGEGSSHRFTIQIDAPFIVKSSSIVVQSTSNVSRITRSSDDDTSNQSRRTLEDVSSSNVKNTKKSTNKKNTKSKQKSVAAAKKEPSTFNFSIFDEKKEERYAILNIGDLRNLSTAASAILRDAASKIREYDLVLDNPINLSLQAEKIIRLEENINSILVRKVPFDDNDFVRITFTDEYVFKNIYFAEAKPNSIYPSKKSILIESPSNVAYFNDVTTNSIIFNLFSIYNKYGQRIKQEGVNFYSQNSVFHSEEALRMFLNSYIFPRTSIVLSTVTKDLIEKFIIGDVRIIDEDFYKKHFMDPSQIPDGLRSNLQRQISQQYESIGDLLGDSWVSGKFEQIDDVDDLFDQLLNYINIADLISLASLCLLKLIPLDELLDAICKPILQKYDEHQTKIIDALSKMEDGVAKDLAKELSEIYFNRILKEQLEQNVAQNFIAGGISKIPGNLKDFGANNSWWNRDFTVALFDLSLANENLLKKNLYDEEINIGFEEQPTFAYSGLTQRVDRINTRVLELGKELQKVNNQLEVFNGINEPQNLVDLRGYYISELSRQTQKRNDTQSSIINGKEQEKIYKILNETIIPHLVNLNPHYDIEKKNSIFKGESPILTNIPPGTDSIDILNNIVINEVQAGPLFNFSSAYSDKTTKERKTEFNLQIREGFLPIINRLDNLKEQDSAPYNVLAELENFGVGAIDDYFFNPEYGIFNDPTKRRYLCLAIILSVPAAAYLIYLIVSNAGDVYKFLKNEAVSVYEAAKKKLQIFSRTDYPIYDILDEFVEALKQIGLNFARDLLLNSVMFVMNKVKNACRDEDNELTNAPFNPIGAIDLSNFMTSSKKGPLGEENNILDNTDSFKIFFFADSSFTVNTLSSILNALSSALTINEIALLLSERASDSLYFKVISIIDTLTPNPIDKEGAFYKYYVNEKGIIEFFQILSSDIEYSKIARAQREYRRQKQTIVEICFGNDDSLIKDLFDGDEEKIREELAANFASKVAVIPELMEVVNSLFSENIVPDPCEMGLSTLTESQKFTARQASESIYGSIENSFERSIQEIKNVFLGTEDKLNAYGSIFDKYEEFVPFTEVVEENQSELESISESNKYVASKILKSADELKNDNNFGFTLLEDGQISFKYENLPIRKSINMNFDQNENSLNFSYSSLVATTDSQGTVISPSGDIAAYIQQEYFDDNLKPKDLLFSGPNVFGFEDYNAGIINQPDYSNIIKISLSTAIKKNDENYLNLLNSIFYDLFIYSFKTGLFNRENFLKLNLRKHLTKTKLNLGNENGSSEYVDACFLGFANAEVLHRQTLSVTELLACRANNSSTKTPFNLAYIKVLFDCFIRSIVTQEMMKSIFVIGTFPRDLVFDSLNPGNISIYEQIINTNISNEIFSFSPIGERFFSYDAFYNNIFKSFIVDMTKVIFQNEEITDDEAFKFAINSQIQFIKNQFNKAYTNAFGTTESILGQTEYQLLAEQTISEGNSSMIDVLDDEFTYNEKIRAIQNDGLAAWNELTTDKPNTKIYFGGSQLIPVPNEEQEEADFIVDDSSITSLDFNEKMPLFYRESSGQTKYFDFDSQEYKFSRYVGDLTHGNTKGLVLDKFLQINFKQDSFSENQKNYIETLLIILGSLVRDSVLNEFSVVENEDGSVDSEDFTYWRYYRLRLKMLLYESKLFMFFPQTIDFIDSLSDKSGELIGFGANQGQLEEFSPLFKQYVEEFNDFNLFYWMFRYNYDSTFFSDPNAISWYNEMVSNGFWNKLDLSLFGKVRLGDFQKLLNKFVNGFSPLPLNSGIPDQDYLNDTEIRNEALPDLGFTVDTLGYINNFGAEVNGIMYARRYIEFLNYFTDGINGEVPSGPSVDSFKLLKLFQPNQNFDNQPFFAWLYSQKINNLIDISSVLRIDMKLPETQNSITKEFSNSLFDSALNNTEEKINKNQKVLLEEKIGPEIANVANINYSLFSAPLFELKEEIPKNLTWYDFLINIDKQSPFFDDEFFNIFNVNDETTSEELQSFIDEASNINKFLFSSDKLDMFSYFNKFKAFSNSSQKESNIVTKDAYLSTYWWNIAGVAVDLKTILTAIYLKAEEGSPYGDFLLSIRNALTDESFASFNKTKQDIDDDVTIQSTGLQKAPLNSSQEDSGILHLVGINSSLNEIERQNLVINVIDSLFDSPDNTISAAKVSFDKDKKFFNPGYAPHIAIKDGIDYGWYLNNSTTFAGDAIIGSAATKLNSLYAGTDFNQKYFYTYKKESNHQPAGPTGDWTRPDALMWLDFGIGFKISEAFGYFPSDGDLEPPAYFTSLIERGTYAKGGLGFQEITKLEKPISSATVNIYDLFGKMLKDDDDKKIFNDLLKCFFLKEQSTITALIQRILTEENYPEINNISGGLINLCYNNLASAIAVANGDYQHTSKSNILTGAAIENALKSAGTELLKAFLKAMASTVDPTWQTPWFLPGPLTPFGVAAKLLDVDFGKLGDESATGESAESKELTPNELLCDDSLRESVDFFNNFIKEWKGSFGQEE